MKYLTDAIHADDIKKKMLSSLQDVCDIVCSTMGPGGRTVAIHTPNGVMSTKDGVTVARYLNLKNKLHNMMAMMAIDAAGKTVKEVGDGTTSTVLLFNQLYKLLNLLCDYEGVNKFEICRGIETAVEDFKQFILDNRGLMVLNGHILMDRLENVAIVSANGDRELGCMVSDLVTSVGENGIIEVKDSNGPETWVEKVDGYVFHTIPFKQFLSAGSGMVELVNPYVLLADIKISDWDEIQPIMTVWKQQCIENGKQRPLVLIVSDIEGSALSTLTLNAKNGAPVLVVKAPAFGGMRYDYMQDIKILTGARQVFSHITGNVFDRFGKGLDYMEKLEFGVCDKFVLKKDKCIIVPSEVKTDFLDDIEIEINLRSAVNGLVEKLKQSIADSEFEGEKDMYRDRVSRLVSGMGTIYVGGDSDIELNYRKMVIDDVQRACFASLKGGIVPGAGIAYLKGMQSLRGRFNLDELSHTYDYAMGYNALIESLSVVYGKVNENLFVKAEEVDINMDISLEESQFFCGVLPGKGENVNFIDKGVIDPADVVISAVKNAASVAKQLYLTEWVLQLEEQQDSNVLGRMLYPERH